MSQSGSLRVCLLNPALVLNAVLVPEFVVPAASRLVVLPLFDEHEVVECPSRLPHPDLLVLLPFTSSLA